MNKYYLITLKNARTYEARDVRLNGLPLPGLHTIVGPGRLEFMARPLAQSGAQLGGFKQLSGIDAEFEIADPGIRASVARSGATWPLRSCAQATRRPRTRGSTSSSPT